MSWAVCAGLLAGTFPAVYADEAPQTPKPLMSVVGKVIDNDDEYFEVSLEVNNHEGELAAVSIVLQYDPQYLLPVTWSGGAIDMADATAWSKRQAMPTLSEQAWNASTALTYADAETNKNYLFMSAEYPGKITTVTGGETGDPSATEAPIEATDVTPTAAPGDGTPDTSSDTGMVVVARFKYADANAKAAIEAEWKDITAGAADKSATANKFISLASDAEAQESPSYYPVGVYYRDGFEVYVNDLTNYTDITAVDNTASDKFEIVLGHGKSALTGGLTLNDITAVLFFDWDDSFLGALTLARDQDGREAVNTYITENLVHPDLRENVNYSSLARIDSYRGIYPAEGPSGTKTVTDGDKYPITDKLDYVFYGKNGTDEVDETTGEKLTEPDKYQYAHGWAPIDDPLTLSDTWTALSTGDTPAAYDFKNGINKSVIYVKAMYYPGEWLDSADSDYSISESYDYLSIDKAKAATGTYQISFSYKRINTAGYGVTRIKEPAIRMITVSNGSTAEVTMEVPLDNDETLPVSLTPAKKVDSVGYQLVDMVDTNISNAGTRSKENGHGKFVSEDFVPLGTRNKVCQAAMRLVSENDTDSWNQIDLQAFTDATIKTGTGGAYATRTLSTGKSLIKACAQAALDKGETEITYYQVQYYIKTKQYVQDKAEAETLCKANCAWTN